MSRRGFVHASSFVALLVMVALCAAGCGPTDPRERVLQDRARWTVTVLNWSQGEDGTVTIGTRLSGPQNSRLDELTVRVQLYDSGSHVIESIWHTFDLSDVQRGGPVDKIVRVREFPREVSGAGIDPVLAPTADEEARIRELQF